MTALEKCPFCGAAATHSPPPKPTDSGIQWGGSVGCPALVGCWGPRVLYDPKDGPETAIMLWNMRAPS
jgi:hypothetical protein